MEAYKVKHNKIALHINYYVNKSKGVFFLYKNFFITKPLEKKWS